MWTFFRSALSGTGEYLSRTENIAHALGSVTALCCTDKKGILSWPNASPEKIFVVKREKKRRAGTVPAAAAACCNLQEQGEQDDKGGGEQDEDEEYTLVPEILVKFSLKQLFLVF